MATPRSRIVDEAVTPWYHCTSRCVRRARLCGQGKEHRKAWIEARLAALVGIFALDCGGFAVMDNHVHVLLRLDSPRAAAWSAEEVARRWSTLHPPRGLADRPLQVPDSRIAELAADAAWVAERRARLSNLGWFMKCLKEPLARLANQEDGCPGAFWEGRYRSVAVLDEAGLLAVAAYIDLNPLAAGLAATPEAGPHTSLSARVEHARAEGAIEPAPGAGAGAEAESHEPSAPPPPAVGPGRIPALWLLPTDDRSAQPGGRRGLAAGLTLVCYLRLVDGAARLARDGKARLDPDAATILRRLGIDAPSWQETLARHLRAKRPAGSHLGSPARLAEAARAHGRRWHRNLFRRVDPPAVPAA
jgi:hypothetical protein